MTTQQLSHQLAWQPEPVKKSEVENPYEEGKILLNGPDEEIELPSMRPIYTKKQLKKIEVSEIYDWFRDQIKKHGKTLAAMGGGAGIAVMMGAV